MRNKGSYIQAKRKRERVGIRLDQGMNKWQLSERILGVKMKRKPFNIFIVVVHILTTENTEEENDKFYCMIDGAKAQCKLVENYNYQERPECKS